MPMSYSPIANHKDCTDSIDAIHHPYRTYHSDRSSNRKLGYGGRLDGTSHGS